MTDFHARLERQLVDAGRRRGSRGRVALAVAGRGRPLVALASVLLTLIATVGLAAALRSSSSSGPGGSAAPSAPPPASSAPGETSGSAAEPSLRGIRVAVLNATTTTGLARSVADVLDRHRATIDSVGTDADQQRARSVVEHRPGAAAQARRVAQVLGIPDVRVLVAANSMIPAADADVLVRLGADRRTP